MCTWVRFVLCFPDVCDNANYRITGIFCGCLIFAEFCGSIEIAEIENRKIFQSRCNMMKLCPKWLFSHVYSDACSVLLLNYLCNAEYTVYVHLDMDCHLNGTRFSVVIVGYKNNPRQLFWWVFNTFSTICGRWKPLSFKMSILSNMLSCCFGRQTPDHSRVCRYYFSHFIIS